MVENAARDNRRWWAVALLCLVSLVLGMDDSVLNLALPSIAEDFQATITQMQWAINAYLLATAALLLLMGALGDRFGRKRLFFIGTILFALGSLAAALSASMGMLIACRAVMGLGCAVIWPQTLSIIRATFDDPKECASAIGVWAGVTALAYGLGPIIGGVLLAHFAWTSVFVLNIPLSIIGLAGGYFLVQESMNTDALKLDPTGAVLSGAALFSLVYGIIEAGRLSWTESSVVIWLAVGVILLALFVIWELRSDHPMLPMRFFKNMSFTGATVPMAMAALASGALLFFLSQYFQSVQGYGPLRTAFLLLPGAGMSFVTASIAPYLANSLGTKYTVSLGLFLGGVGLFLMSLLTTGTQWYALVGAFLVQGAGYGLAFSPASASIMGSLPVKRAGIGSAMDNTVQQIGYVLGVAGLGAALNTVYRDRVSHLQALASLPQEASEAIRDSIQAAHIVAGDLPSDISQQIVQGSNEAFTSGVERALIIGASVMLAATLFSLLVLPSKIRPSDE